jgi:peptidoglycan/xylan/chitin deacetylase (PgdA/CDA1 family)
MNHPQLIVAQCWDDGVTSDRRLVDVLRRHGARASFNLNAGLIRPDSALAWTQGDRAIHRLGWNELRQVYQGFTIANHGLTHAALAGLEHTALEREVVQGRDRLQQFFGQPVRGFVYPFGSFDQASMQVVRTAGHRYGRTTMSRGPEGDAGPALAWSPSCHVLAPDFWSRYEAARAHGVFHFWGHSYEWTGESEWAAFESMIARISGDDTARWGELEDLFDSS